MTDKDDEYSFGSPLFAPLWRFLGRFVVDGNPNPTKEWVRNPEIDLVLDLDKSELNGKTFGEPISALSFLGKCDECMPMITQCVDERNQKLGTASKSYNLSFCADGLGVSTDDTWNVDQFVLHINPHPSDPREPIPRVFTPYTGTLILNGATIDNSLLQTVDLVTKTFGAPDKDRETPARKQKFAGKEFALGYSRFLRYQKLHASWYFFVDETKLIRSIFVGRALPHELGAKAETPAST